MGVVFISLNVLLHIGIALLGFCFGVFMSNCIRYFIRLSSFMSSCVTDCFVAYWNQFVRFLSWSNCVLSGSCLVSQCFIVALLGCCFGVLCQIGLDTQFF